MASKMPFVKSFAHAARGLGMAVKEERNFRLQVAAGIIVYALAWLLGVSRVETVLLTIVIFLVLGFELLNTIIEQLLDALKPRIHSYVRNVKDLMAGAVLLVSAGAAVAGFLVFYPYMLDWIIGLAR